MGNGGLAEGLKTAHPTGKIPFCMADSTIRSLSHSVSILTLFAHSATPPVSELGTERPLGQLGIDCPFGLSFAKWQFWEHD